MEFEEPPGYRWRWMILFVVLAAEVMDLLDSMIVGIAAPSIRRDLGGSYSNLQWIGAAYTLAMAVGLITGGRLGDIVGRRRMFLIGAAGFTTGSLLCAFAQSPEMLIGSRFLQGVFGAVMIPQGLGIIKQVFPPKEMAAAFGMFGPIMGLSSVGGPILAGWLIDADYFGTGWRMIFLVNLPLGLLAVLGGLRYLPEVKPKNAPRLDLVGMLLAAAGSFLLVYPLVQGREDGWPAWTYVSMAAAAVCFAAFARYEVRVRRTGRDPLIVPTLFRKRGFTGGLIVGLVFFAGMAGFILAFGLFIQLGLGYSPLKAGLTQIPMSVGIVIGMGAGMAVAAKLGRRLIHLGAAVMALGVAGLAVTVHLGDLTAWDFAPALLVAGTGMGLLMGPFFDIVLAAVEPDEAGSASGTLSAIQQLGNTVGVAVLGTIFFSLVGGGAKGAAHFSGATQTTLWIAVGALALTFAVAFLLPRFARPEEHAESEPLGDVVPAM